MNKKEIESIFEKKYLPAVKEIFEYGKKRDIGLRRKACENILDKFWREGKITFKQMKSWKYPKSCTGGRNR